MISRFYFSFLLILLSTSAFSANDSIVFNNGNIIVGEIQGMTRGVLTVETDYSDSDFKIEWDGIAEIYGVNYFLISLSDGTRVTGSFASNPDGKILLKSEITIYEVDLDDIVFIKSVDQDFWSRVYASIDLSLSIAKANNLNQLNTRSNLGYIADLWSVSGSFSQLFSERDDVETTRRTDASASFNYFLPKDWYIPVNISFLSNTEQKLDLRINARLGFGKYVIHTNQSYWGFSLGASYNDEKYSTEAEQRKSWEGFVSTELNLYDVGDIDLLVSATVYQGLTETDRFRSDIKFDAKYDLPLDFYIRAGFTVNYDNIPAEGASKTDYIIDSGFGWEL
jgi:hypothetical protein